MDKSIGVAKKSLTIQQQIKQQEKAAIRVAEVASRLFDGYGWDTFSKRFAELRRATDYYDSCYVEKPARGKG